jgi:hypothetical protein
MRFKERGLAALARGGRIERLLGAAVVPELARARSTWGDDELEPLEALAEKIDRACEEAAS